jgi:hypothetical protein
MKGCAFIPSSWYCYDVEYSTILSEFSQVRGTPASGKSTLARLLSRHIQEKETGVRVLWIDGWESDVVRDCGGWSSYLRTEKLWNRSEKTVFIFDDAQVTYNDVGLWNNLFKGIKDYFPYRRAIAFASYGSPSLVFTIKGTPNFVADTARVSLLPTAHDDNLPAAGLLFTRAEFDELVSKQYSSPEYYFDPSFFDMVFRITEGHVGAMSSFIKIILESNVCTVPYTFYLSRSRY